MRSSIILFILMAVISSLHSQKKLNIIASASMIKDMAKHISGDLHNLEMIVPIGGDPHLHKPTPSNARIVAAADLILINGLTFEGWITELIDNSGTNADVITVTEGIDVLTSQTYKNSADPHAWMAASNVLMYSENIANALIKLDPENANIYNNNLNSYKSELSALDKEIEEAIASIPQKQRILITSHDAFQYFGRRYGIQLEAIMGISTEAEARTADIKRVNKVIREQQVPAIFIESTINPKLMQQLAQDNKITIGGKLYADSLGDEDSPAATYIDMMRYNTQTIVKALTTQLTSDSKEHNAAPTNFSFLIVFGAILFIGLGLTIYFLNK